MTASAPPLLSVDELVWHAMGSRARVLVIGGPPDALEEAQSLIQRWERQWSRFDGASDVSRLNEAAGHLVQVADETLDLIEAAMAWSEATEGRFDPTVLPALEAAGYVQDLRLGTGPIRDGSPAPGVDGILIDRATGSVLLPRGTSIDLGGIGKGRAVDLLVEHLRPLALGVLVDLGGDLRVAGNPPHGAEGWAIAVDDLRHDDPTALLWLEDGAVATSTTLRRRWTAGDRSAHHLIDPSTGRPTDGALVSATVVAALTTGAEVLAKAAIVAGTIEAAARLLEAHDVAGLLVPADGEPIAVGGFPELCWRGAAR